MNLIQELRNVAQGDDYWKHRFRYKNKLQSFPFGIHLAIFVEPYLEFILQGKKTVESRFSLNRIAPYQRVRKGDVILLKRSGGPIIGLCEISKVWNYELDPKSWKYIKKEFTYSICAQDPQFWLTRKDASYATLMKIKHPLEIDPVYWPKKNRMAWVVLHNGQNGKSSTK